jgi:hypothetical protein
MFVPEDVPIGYVSGTVAATDPDGGSLNITLTSPSTDFAVASNGFVSTARVLNFEVTTQFVIFVTATDPAGLFGRGNVTVRVVDANDPPVLLVPSPTTPLGTFNVSEAAPVGTVLAATVRGSDEDEDALVARGFSSRLVYGLSFSAGGPTGCGTAFAIAPGNGQVSVVTAGVLDFETAPVCAGVVTVTDPSGAVASHTLSIAVLDANEPPVFSGCGLQTAPDGPCVTLTVGEGATPGTVVNTGAPIVAVDPDAGSTVTLTLLTASPFTLESSSGLVTLASPLDYEAQRTYTLQVRKGMLWLRM